ncbi:MAG: CMP-N-acetylneuraminic acid synthetase [Bacteroidetes bacterium]|nr:CMP-N-acetylneuraminic acid synthetase [Bacteroidota bacterium]
MDSLFLITARGGSKGIPGKNIKPLAGKPLIHYAIDVARKCAADEFICVSTDDEAIIECVKEKGLTIPFRRPASLAADTSGSYEVIMHALEHYAAAGKRFRNVVLLQPTSPFRTAGHVKEAMALYSDDLDMVVSVKKTQANPFYLYKEDENGLLQKLSESTYERRQDLPEVFELNGAVYVFNVASLEKQPISAFKKIKKYVMPELNSVDIDDPIDWEWSEFLIEKKLIRLE